MAINQAIALYEPIQLLAAGSSQKRHFEDMSTQFCISSLRRVFNMFYNSRTAITTATVFVFG
jgi:ABC-type tungstate transport system substrate-binding protein